MSFITKRDRIFTEVDLSDLPPRNEGKLKAYASLVDARAWSHYTSDKSEHLFELIKRNNGKCKQQLIPVDVIVNTLMGAKNAEIERLKGRINQMERLLSAYEKMELTPEQRAYVNKARAAVLASSSDLTFIKGDGDGQRVPLFDANGNPVGGYDANGNPMEGGMYDTNGILISAPFFDATGNPVIGYDANGNSMESGMHDANGNLISGYDANGNPMEGVRTNGRMNDANGNLIAGYDANGNPMEGGRYDANANLFSGYDANGNPMEGVRMNGRMYDASGNLISGHDANGNPIEGHDANSNPIEGHDANSNPIEGYDANGNPMEGIRTNGRMYDANGNLISGLDANDNPIEGFDANETVTMDFDADEKDTVVTDDCTCEIPPSRSDTCFSTCLSAFSGVTNGVTVCPCERPCGKPKGAKICMSCAPKRKPSKIPVPDLDSRSRLPNLDTNIKDDTSMDAEQHSLHRASSCIPIPQDRQGSNLDNRQRSRSLVVPNPEITTKRVSCTDTVCELRSPPGSSSVKITDSKAEIKPCHCTPKEIVSARRSSGSVLRGDPDNRSLCRALKGDIETRSVRGSIHQEAKTNSIKAEPLPVQVSPPSRLPVRGSSIDRGPGTLSALGSCDSKGPEISYTRSGTAMEKNGENDNMDTLKQQILKKDSELAAMQNTISILESDVCEPYCVYAKIYTMLEKILAILKQNKKYMKFLDAVTQSKDISDLDLRAKIVFKLNVLEKFSSALTMGCKKNSHGSPNPCKGCQDTECYHSEVFSYLNPSFGLPSIDDTDFENNCNRLQDDDRTRLVAQIIEADEFNSVIQSINNDVLSQTHQNDDMDNMSTKMKELQDCYDELLNAYSDLKDERDALVSKIIECEEALQELEGLKYKYQELSRQNDYYRAFAEEAHKFKDHSLVLSEQVENLENELRCQLEINSLNSSKLLQLSDENGSSRKYIEDISLGFEEEKSQLMFKVNELECCASCQETEIGSLSIQLETLMKSQKMYESRTLADTMELNSIKRQLSNLNDLLNTSQKENEELQTKLSEYEKILQAVQSEFHNIQGECEALSNRNRNFVLDNDEFRKELDDKDREILYLTVKVNSLTQSSYTDSQGEPSFPDNQFENKGTSRAHSETAESGQSNSTDRKLKEEFICLTEKQSCNLMKASESYVSTGQKDEDQESYFSNQVGMEKGSSESVKQPHEADQQLLDELHNITTAYDLLNKEKIRLENELVQYIENIPNQRDFESEITKIKNSYVNLKSECDGMKYDLSKQKQRENDLLVYNERLQNLLGGNNAINQEIGLNENVFAKQLEQEINQLRDLNDLMKRENEKILDDLEQMRESNGLYENNFLSTKQSIDKLNDENNILKGEIEELRCSMNSIKRERESLLNDYESYIRRNTVEFETLENHLSGIKTSCTALEQENEILKIELEQFKSDNSELIQERNSLMRLCEELNRSSENNEKDFANKLESLNKAYSKLEADHKNLQIKLITSNNDNRTMNIEMQELQNEISDLSEQKDDLFNKVNLMNKEKALPEVSSGLKDCQLEIEQLKMDILKNQNIIGSLSSQLDSSEKKAAGFNVELIQQTDKNRVVESQIARLEEEIIKLHGHLDSAITSGEDIKKNSLKAVERSLAETQAHHSRATHDIKAELFALQMSHLKCEETSSLDNSIKAPSVGSRISSKLFFLQKGRKSLEKYVEKLESATKNALKAVGKDGISPRETVNKSLDMLTNAMEHQDLDYQNLERLYLEAKLSIESITNKYEKLREELENIHNQHIQEKQALEKQFDDERQNLKFEKNLAQKLKDELIEKSRENEKIKINADTYVRDLESELEILKDIYNNAQDTIGDLIKKNNGLTNDNNKIQNILDASNEEMKTKLKDIEYLENELKHLKALMVYPYTIHTATQTDLENAITKAAMNQSSLSLVSLQPINQPNVSRDNKNIHSGENISEENISVSSLLKETNKTLEPINESMREKDENMTAKTSKLQQYINLVRSIQSTSTVSSNEQESIIYSIKELSILQEALQETDDTDSWINKLNIDVLNLKVSSHSDNMHDSLNVHLTEPTDISTSSNQSYNFKALLEEKETQVKVMLLHTETQTDEFIDPKLLNDIEEYKIRIQKFTSIVAAGERDFNIKLTAIKTQFDNNMRNIINEHNEGIERMQVLHEETVRDLIRQHESEIETLRAISTESVKVTEGLIWKNKELRRKLNELMEQNKENTVASVGDSKSKVWANLTVTMVEMFDIKPKKRHASPVCAADSSEIAKSRYEKGDTDDGKLAAQNFFKTIIKKVYDGGSMDVLNLQELSHLHEKVCHLWRSKQTKDEGNQKKMATLEYDLLKKKQSTIQRIMELEAAVHEERKRLHEVRDTMYSDMISTDKLSPALGCRCHDGLEMGSHMQDVSYTVSKKKTRLHGPRLVCAPQTSKQIRPHQYENEPPTRLKDVTPRKDM